MGLRNFRRPHFVLKYSVKFFQETLDPATLQFRQQYTSVVPSKLHLKI